MNYLIVFRYPFRTATASVHYLHTVAIISHPHIRSPFPGKEGVRTLTKTEPFRYSRYERERKEYSMYGDSYWVWTIVRFISVANFVPFVSLFAACFDKWKLQNSSTYVGVLICWHLVAGVGKIWWFTWIISNP